MMMILGSVYKMGDKGAMADRSIGGVAGVGVVLHLITWVAILAVLFALARLLWKKGSKVK